MTTPINNITSINKTPSSMTRRFLSIFAPVIIFIGLLLFFFNYSHTKSELTALKINEAAEVEMQSNIIVGQFNNILSDLAFLSEHHELKTILDDSRDYSETYLENDYLSFSVNKKIYDQIRYIDKSGKEVIRINYNNGTPTVVSRDALQYKTHRYYFTETIALEKGSFYVSPFDLNIENGIIERPIKPVIRFGKPLFDSKNVIKGVLVLNYLGAELIKQFKSHDRCNLDEVSLLNKDGYWLSAPHSGDEWGFMVKERSDRRYGNDFPDAWRKISGDGSGQFINEDGLFTFKAVYPVKAPSLSAGKAQPDSAVAGFDPAAYHWIVVQRVPPDILTQISSGLLNYLALIYAVIVIITAAVAFIAAKATHSRRLAEEALKKSDANLKGVIKSVGVGILEIDASSKIIFANEELSTIFGYTDGELTGSDLAMLIPERSRSAHRNGMTKYIAGNSPGVMLGKRVELDGLKKDGTEFPLELRIEELFKQGSESRFTGAIQDISERKRIEEELKESSIFLKESQKIANLGTYIFEVKENLWQSSEILDEIFGIDKNYKRNMEGWLNIICPDSREELARYLSDEVIGKRGSFDKEYCIIRKGKKREVHGLGELEFDENGEVLRMVGTIQDITERKRMEEEMLKSEKLESLGVLAGGIAHDFNNLLGTILANVSYAREITETKDEVYRSMLESEKAIVRARDLTQQLLSFSRGGAPVKKVLYIGELIKDAARFGIMGSNVELELDISPDLKTVEIDEGQLSQVIHNIVINAGHAMPGGGLIEVKANNITHTGVNHLPLDSGSYVLISIKDHGAGIAKENLSKIFDPFFTTKQMGSGLGLATAYTVIKNHHGHIDISSEVGIGTTFDIYLLVSYKEPHKEDTRNEAFMSGEGRILVMDDEEPIRKIVCKILTRLGYYAEGVSDGSEAIECYRRAMESGSRFDMVIMDLTIPGGMGGKEATAALLKIDPKASVVASSGYSDDLVISEYKKHGFKNAIEKPYTMTTLSQIVFKVLEDR